jgi:hypothetical protein
VVFSVFTASAKVSGDSGTQKIYRTVKPRPRLKRSVSTVGGLKYFSTTRVDGPLPMEFRNTSTVHDRFPSPTLTCLKAIVLLT